MNFTDPSTLCLLLLAATVAFLLIRTRSQLARQRQRWAAEEMQTRRNTPADRQSFSAGGAPDELARWEVEMHETARRLSAELDAKLSLLQALVAEAEAAAQRLEEALDRAYPSFPLGSQAESLRPAAEQASDLRQDLGTRAELHRPKSDEPPPPGRRSHHREEIYRLADYGFDAAEIARRVGSPVGEVELILSLPRAGEEEEREKGRK